MHFHSWSRPSRAIAGSLLGLAAALAATFATTSCGDEPAGAADNKPLTLWWFDWDPPKGLRELAKDFTKETGIEVDVQVIPLPDYQTKTFQEFGTATASHPTAFDIIIGDSQWIGRGAAKGLYVELTEWLPTVVDLKSIHARAAKYLCEYPENSGRWYAAPAETDAIGICYRKDWFEDATEQAAFAAKYGRPLAVPDTWDEFKQVAEFFQRPAQNRYGCAFTTGRAYDALTMGFQNLLWAYGGAWHAEGSNSVKGALDTPGTVAAINMFRELIKLGPNGAENLDYGQSVEYFLNNSTAMVVNYFAFFPGIAKNLGDKAGFAVIPKGPNARVSSLGGQGFSISTKIAPARQEKAKKFIAWFLKKDVQEQWITKPGGFTAHAEVLKSEAFRKATPYNAPFADSIDSMRDFWNVPCFNELMSVTQQYLGQAIDGQMDPMAAMQKLAEEKEAILQREGLLK